MDSFEQRLKEMTDWFDSPRFKGVVRLYSPRQVVEQRGSIPAEYPVARSAAEGFYWRLRELCDQGKSITTFGPYSPGQAVVIKKLGIEGIYLGGWATSAKGSITEDPGADLASYPLSQVPDEASAIVRALAPITDDMLRSRFDAERMNRDNVYPGWRDDAGDVIAAYRNLQTFLISGAQQSLGLLVWCD